MNVYVKWVLLSPLTAVMYVVGILLAPVLPLFASEDGWLPEWLSWFQTPDNPIDGDRGHLKRWEGWPIYIRRVAWLLRNCAYGFDETICGIASLPTDRLIEVGETKASDVRGISGTCHRWLFRGDKLIAFHYYRVWHYQVWRFKACMRISMGWKLWNPDCMAKQYTIYLHPFKKARWEKDNG